MNGSRANIASTCPYLHAFDTGFLWVASHGHNIHPVSPADETGQHLLEVASSPYRHDCSVLRCEVHSIRQGCPH
jgi:hypothetical protein